MEVTSNQSSLNEAGDKENRQKQREKGTSFKKQLFNSCRLRTHVTLITGSSFKECACFSWWSQTESLTSCPGCDNPLWGTGFTFRFPWVQPQQLCQCCATWSKMDGIFQYGSKTTHNMCLGKRIAYMCAKFQPCSTWWTSELLSVKFTKNDQKTAHESHLETNICNHTHACTHIYTDMHTHTHTHLSTHSDTPDLHTNALIKH